MVSKRAILDLNVDTKWTMGIAATLGQLFGVGRRLAGIGTHCFQWLGQSVSVGKMPTSSDRNVRLRPIQERTFVQNLPQWSGSSCDTPASL